MYAQEALWGIVGIFCLLAQIMKCIPVINCSISFWLWNLNLQLSTKFRLKHEMLPASQFAIQLRKKYEIHPCNYFKMCHFNGNSKRLHFHPLLDVCYSKNKHVKQHPVCRQMYVITDLVCYYAANNSKTYVKVHKDVHLEEINDKAWMRGRLRGRKGMNEGMKVQDSRTEMCVCLPVYKAA